MSSLHTANSIVNSNSKRKNSCAKFGDIVYDTDAFGENFSFKLPNGKERHTTKCGVFITFLICSILAVYCLIKLNLLLYYGDSTINQYTKEAYFDENFKWNSTMGMHFAFGLTDFDGNQEPIDDPDYGQLVARYVHWGIATDFEYISS